MASGPPGAHITPWCHVPLCAYCTDLIQTGNQIDQKKHQRTYKVSWAWPVGHLAPTSHRGVTCHFAHIALIQYKHAIKYITSNTRSNEENQETKKVSWAWRVDFLVPTLHVVSQHDVTGHFATKCSNCLALDSVADWVLQPSWSLHQISMYRNETNNKAGVDI